MLFNIRLCSVFTCINGHLRGGHPLVVTGNGCQKQNYNTPMWAWKAKGIPAHYILSLSMAENSTHTAHYILSYPCKKTVSIPENVCNCLNTAFFQWGLTRHRWYQIVSIVYGAGNIRQLIQNTQTRDLWCRCLCHFAGHIMSCSLFLLLCYHCILNDIIFITIIHAACYF